MLRAHPEVRDGEPLVDSQEVSGPDSARSMHALENPAARSEDDRDLARLAENLARRGFYRSMISPVGEGAMDEVVEEFFREQIAIHQRLWRELPKASARRWNAGRCTRSRSAH